MGPTPRSWQEAAGFCLSAACGSHGAVRASTVPVSTKMGRAYVVLFRVFNKINIKIFNKAPSTFRSHSLHVTGTTQAQLRPQPSCRLRQDAVISAERGWGQPNPNSGWIPSQDHTASCWGGERVGEGSTGEGQGEEGGRGVKGEQGGPCEGKGGREGQRGIGAGVGRGGTVREVEGERGGQGRAGEDRVERGQGREAREGRRAGEDQGRGRGRGGEGRKRRGREGTGAGGVAGIGRRRAGRERGGAEEWGVEGEAGVTGESQGQVRDR